MPFNDTMTALMDKAHKITGLTDKLNLIQLTGLMDHFDLHVNPNLLKQTAYTSLIRCLYKSGGLANISFYAN